MTDWQVGDLVRDQDGRGLKVTTTHSVSEWISDGRIYRRENNGPVVEVDPRESGLLAALPDWLIEECILPQLRLDGLDG